MFKSSRALQYLYKKSEEDFFIYCATGIGYATALYFDHLTTAQIVGGANALFGALMIRDLLDARKVEKQEAQSALESKIEDVTSPASKELQTVSGTC